MNCMIMKTGIQQFLWLCFTRVIRGIYKYLYLHLLQMTEPSQKRKRVRSRLPWELPDVRRSNDIKKPFIVFDFRLEKPRSRLTVPACWVAEDKWCYWPPPKSEDETRVAQLIKQSSEPNKKVWIKLPGKIKGKFESYFKAESYLLKSGTTSSETERAAAVSSQMELHAQSNTESSPFSPSSDNETEEPPKKVSRSSCEECLRKLDIHFKALEHRMENISVSLESLNVAVNVMQKEVRNQNQNSTNKGKRITALEAKENLKSLQVPVGDRSELWCLESKLQKMEEKVLLRSSLSAMFPKEVNGTLLQITRKVVRLIGGDEVFQFFRVCKALGDKNFSSAFPILFEVLISVIMHKGNSDYDETVSTFARHLSKCTDRKKSKEFVKSRLKNENDCVYSSDSSNDSNVSSSNHGSTLLLSED